MPELNNMNKKEIVELLNNIIIALQGKRDADEMKIKEMKSGVCTMGRFMLIF